MISYFILLICLIYDVFIYSNIFVLEIFFKINNNFIFFSRTRFVKVLNFILWKINLIIITRYTSTYRRTLSIYLFTSTVLTLTMSFTITSLFIYFNSSNFITLLFKCFFINFFSFLYDKLPCLFKFFFIKTVFTSTRITTES